MQFHMVRDFYVTNCDGGVKFRMNAFRDLGQLEYLYLEKIRRVEFESGVFQGLNKLSLYNIEELKFGERAFMGAHDLRNIQIRRVSIPRLHSHSLFDIRGLHSLELEEVQLQNVEKDAVKIDFRPSESHVLISNCTVSIPLLQIWTSNFASYPLSLLLYPQFTLSLPLIAFLKWS
jgi:hypothetical protein